VWLLAVSFFNQIHAFTGRFHRGHDRSCGSEIRTLMRRMRALSSLLGLTLVFSTGVACSTGSATGQQGRAPGGRGAGGGPAPITATTVVQKPMPVEIEAIGSGEPFQTVSVHAQLTGELTSVNFKEGDEVQEGQVLFTLDRRPLEAALLVVQANLDRDSAQAANARAQAERYQDLAKRGIAPRDQLDQALTAATALDATVAADRAAVENAKIQLQYATIRAPLTGRTGQLMVHPGNLVRANDTEPLVVINQVAPLYVTFAIPESRLADLKRYMALGSLKVEAQLPGDQGKASGRISFVDNQVDVTTGTIKVKALFANEKHLLWPGQYVNVAVTLTTDPTAVVVPTTAIQTGQQGSYVFIVKDDQTAELRNIKIARAAGTETVVAEGLKAGETVVTDGQLRLVTGTRVAIKTAAGEPQVAQ
jgi:multidrug efflux system membrane fusion protein